MRPVEFTQFMFPKARRESILIEREDAIADKAEKLKCLGFSFEIENNNERIWATIINHETERAVDNFCANGPPVSKMIDDLIMRAYDKYVTK